MDAPSSAPPAIRRHVISVADLAAAKAFTAALPPPPVASASPAIGSVIPAISGHEVKCYEAVFNHDIVYRSANGDVYSELPLVRRRLLPRANVVQQQNAFPVFCGAEVEDLKYRSSYTGLGGPCGRLVHQFQ